MTKKPKRVAVDPDVENRYESEKVALMFIDSGAHSLYNVHAYDKRASLGMGHKDEVYSYYETQPFWDYVDAYAAFIKEHKDAVDYYVNVDAIFNPEITWRVQVYLEDHHKLSPVPVLHYGTPIKWFDRYLKRGYEFIGLGGVGQGVSFDAYFSEWGDRVYEHLCPAKNNYRPIVKTHGFAMTAYRSLIRYPWWSVDSASWVKAGGFGRLFVPLKVKGVFDFSRDPYTIAISTAPPDPEKEAVKKKLADKNRNAFVKKDRIHHPAAEVGTSYSNASPQLQALVAEWLEQIEVPLGKIDKDGNEVERGVLTHYVPRMHANLKFFARLSEWLPEWPWAFRPDRVSKPVRKGFF